MKYLAPVPKQYVDESGIPYSGGTVSVYLHGTPELAEIYSGATGEALIENPCTLDSNGSWQCFVPSGVPLDYIVMDADGNVVSSFIDVVIPEGSGGSSSDMEVVGTPNEILVDRRHQKFVVALSSTIKNAISDLADSVTSVLSALGGKADKVTNATSGNFAGLDANGNLSDSGSKAADFASAAQGAKADTAIQGVKVNGTELSKDGNNKVDVPVPTASTATPLKNGTASAGSSSQWARGDHRHPTDDSREAVSNKKQVVNDSSTTEYPSSKAVADFVNSSVATNTANFLGTIAETSLGLDYTATNEQIALALNVHTWVSSPTNNDYCFVSVNDPQTTDVDEYRRFKFNGSVWAYEYTLNNSSFTQAQWDAINSGLTSSDRTTYNAAVTLLNTHVGDSGIHVTSSEKNAWNAKQDTVSTDTDSSAFGDNTSIATGFSSNKLHLNIASRLWAYIQGKISSVLGLTASSYGGKAATADSVSATAATANNPRRVWFSDALDSSKRAYNDNFLYNPVTNILTTNISGNASTASAAASGSALESAINAKVDSDKSVAIADVRITRTGQAGSGWYKVAETPFNNAGSNVNAVFDVYASRDNRKYVGNLSFCVRSGSTDVTVNYNKLFTDSWSTIYNFKIVVKGIINAATIEIWASCTHLFGGVALVERNTSTYTAGYLKNSWSYTSHLGDGGTDAPVSDSANNFYVYDTDIVVRLDESGDASNTTSTFTKDASDTSSMTSGRTLSAIFGAISSSFASLKALAFKDKASYTDLSSGVQSSLDKADTALQAAVEYVTTSSTWQTLETAYNAGKTLILKVENGTNWFDEYKIVAVNKSSGSDRFIFCGFPTMVNLVGRSVESLEVTEWICYLDGSATRWVTTTVDGLELPTKDYVEQVAADKADKVTITGATKTKITYNSQGIVTAGEDLDASDIPTSLPAVTAGIAPRQFPYRQGTTTIGGRTYNTVIIGNQEWLNSDLQYNDSGTGIVTATEGTYIGHLYYNWEAAKRVSASVGNGWRLPTIDDVNTLFDCVGRSIAGALLKSTAGWGNSSSYNGKNSYGLDILPTGRTISGTNSNQGWNAYYWTANSSEGAGAAFRFAAVEASAPGFYPENTYCQSIRLVRNISSNISDLPAVGSSSQPVYMDTDGSMKPCGFSVNFGTPVSGANVLNIITA